MTGGRLDLLVNNVSDVLSLFIHFSLCRRLYTFTA